MIGFFEHQYLSYKKNHIRNLLALARADGSLHPKEEKLLYKIGKRYGLKDRQIKNILENTEDYTVVIPDNHNDKMNLIYDLLLMVHADERIEKNEVSFVEDTVNRFGLRREMVQWLLSMFAVKGIPPPADDWEDIKKEAEEKFAFS